MGILFPFIFLICLQAYCKKVKKTFILQLFKLLFDYDNFLARVQRNCLNKRTEFSFLFSKICYIPTPDSQIVNFMQ